MEEVKGIEQDDVEGPSDETSEVDVTTLTDEELAPDAAPEVKEEVKTETVPAVKEGEETVKEETLEDIKAERDKLKAETQKERELRKQQEIFIQRRNGEVGNLRKEAEALRNELMALREDPARYLADPVAAARAAMRERELEQGIQRAETLAGTQDRELTVKHYVPDIENLVSDMADVLVKDDPDNQAFADFLRQNPRNIGNLDPGMAVNLAHRVKAEKELAALRDENKSLKEKLANNSRSVVNKIAAAAKESPKLSGKVYGESSVGEELALTEEQIAKMSDEELAKIP